MILFEKLVVTQLVKK